MLRDERIRRVSDGLVYLQILLKGRTVARLMDLHVVSEDFVKDFLNCARDLNLKNLNVNGSNYPAIDLGDETRRIAFQVTTEFRATKIRTTLEKFMEHNLHTSYDRVCVVILGEKQRQYTTIKATAVGFDPQRDIIDIPDLIREIGTLSDSKLADLVSLIEAAGLGTAASTDSDADAVRKIHSEFNRDALKHQWHQEGSIGRFSNALTELTELLGRGTINGGRVTVPIHRIKDVATRSELEEVRDALSILRAAYNARVNTNEIREDSAFAFFKDPESARELNAAKAGVLATISKAGRRYSLPEIRMLGREYPG